MKKENPIITLKQELNWYQKEVDKLTIVKKQLEDAYINGDLKQPLEIKLVEDQITMLQEQEIAPRYQQFVQSMAGNSKKVVKQFYHWLYQESDYAYQSPSLIHRLFTPFRRN